ncbi:MAG: hypothetical protein Q7J64_01735, partial [Elusimicrobiota bacterium]|nr:hypothetical protein [Elusimicrobiota bacterium]
MIRRSRRVPLLAACAFALAAPLSALAGDLTAVAVAPIIQPTAPQISGTLTTPDGQRMLVQLNVLETALIKHLKGEQPSTFEVLNGKRLALKKEIEAASLTAGDRKTLDDRLGRSESVIARSLRLNGGGAVLDPEVSKAIARANAGANPAAAKDPLYQTDALLGDLDRASATPAEAEKIFDNLNRRYGAPDRAASAAPVNFGAIRKTLEVTYTPDGAPGTNAAKARNLSRDLAAPVQASNAGAPLDFTHQDAISLNVRRAALEKDILAHLTGEGAFSFEGLKIRLEVLKTALGDAADIPEGERAALAELLLRDERMLTGGAALARGAERLDSRLVKILSAATKSNQHATAVSVDVVISGLLSVATTRDPAQADRVFDNLRVRLRADFAMRADLDAVKTDFAQKSPIRYTPPVASGGGDAVQNCQEALNGAVLSAGGLCKYSPVGASLLAGLLDAVHQQFGTAAGVVSNVIALLLGLLFGLMTGGVGLIIKILFALGMTLWAIYELVPLFAKAIKALWNSKPDSLERYAAIRQLSALAGGVLIMGLLAVVGGKIGPKIGASKFGTAMEARITGISTKVGARVPTRISAMLAKMNASIEAKMAPPKMAGDSHVTPAPGKILPSAVHSADKGYVLVAEESLSAAKSGKASQLVEKTIIEHLEKNLAPDMAVDPAKARSILAAALGKADLALKKHAVLNPAEAAKVDLSVAIVAKNASGGSVLVAAEAGDAGIFLRSSGRLYSQRPTPAVAGPPSPRLARMKAGIKNFASEWWNDVKGVKSAAPVQAHTTGKVGALFSGKAAPGEALGSSRYKAPQIHERALQPKDVVFAANRDVASMPRAIAELNIPGKRGAFGALVARLGSRETSHRVNVFQQAAVRYTPPPPAGQINFDPTSLITTPESNEVPRVELDEPVVKDKKDMIDENTPPKNETPVIAGGGGGG